VVVAGDTAVFFGELDEPRTEGQRLVRALDPELVWLAHVHEPWRPRTLGGRHADALSVVERHALMDRYRTLSWTHRGTADRCAAASHPPASHDKQQRVTPVHPCRSGMALRAVGGLVVLVIWIAVGVAAAKGAGVDIEGEQLDDAVAAELGVD
jgi:hypothetical protein